MPAPAPKSERELIRRVRRACQGDLPPGARALLGDDMAPLVPTSAGEILWTTDMLMDGVDFRSEQHDWHAIGRKAMAVNLSDCAAMAVEPIAALCAVALCDRLSLHDAERLHAGVREMGLAFDCPLVGGDTNSWPAPTVICVTVAGRVPEGRRPVLRSGARPGDQVFLTGRLGGSLLGRHLTFTPRVREALRIAAELRPTAMIDISDGLGVDLWHICDESGCGAQLDADALAASVHPDAERRAVESGRAALEHALYDGEDFELIVVLPPETDAAAAGRLGLRRIGCITLRPEVVIRGQGGDVRPLERRGWEHFR